MAHEYKMFIYAALVVLLNVGCTTVGTGTRTIVKATCDLSTPANTCRYLLDNYPQLISDVTLGDPARIQFIDKNGTLGLKPNEAQAAFDSFEHYMDTKYGVTPTFQAVDMNASIRDRTKVPVFLPVDFRKELVAKLLDPKMKPEDREKLRSIMLIQPDLYDTTSWHGTVKGIREHWYYPRLSVDYSTILKSVSHADRFSMLQFVMRLVPSQTCPSSSRARFIDFAPKEADLAEFTRGQLTQTLQAQATSQATNVASDITAVAKDGTTTTDSMQATRGNTPVVTFTDAYVSQLTDAIERRSTGLLENGRAFVASFRSLREVRVSGTYNFDLMLEIPVNGEKTEDGKFMKLSPKCPELKADIYLIAVVRHIHDRGRVGFLHRVPESENDRVYEQVVVNLLEDQVIWTHKGENWLWPIVSAEPTCTLDIVVTEDKAQYVVRNSAGKTVEKGQGNKSLSLHANASSGTCDVKIEFLPVTSITDSRTVTRKALPVGPLSIPAGEKETAIGRY